MHDTYFVVSPGASLPVDTVLAALTGVDHERLSVSTPRDCTVCWSVHRIMVGWKKNCIPLVLTCLALILPLGALSQGIDEGEFSREMLAHKLHLLNSQFELAQFLMRSGTESKLKDLQRVNAKIKCLKVEFRHGRIEPDLLDEQIVIVREELRSILADAIDPAST